MKSMKIKEALIFFLLAILFITTAQETKGTFKTEVCTQYSYGYLLQKPQNIREKKPLIVFLHGSGEKGINLDLVKANGPLKYIKAHPLDAYVLAPQCPQDSYWESNSLYLLVQKIIQENNIDTNRIYLTGLSMGAWGAWNLAFAHSEMFAAIVPIAGFVDRVPMIENCKIKDIPTWIFHGLLDDVVDVNYSVVIYTKLKACKGNVKLTIFDDANHDSWSRVYDNQEIYDWMFQQIKKPQ